MSSSSAVEMKSEVRRARRQAKKGKSKQKGGGALHPTGAKTAIWNLYAEAIPRFGGVQKKDNVPYKFTQSLDLGTLYSTSTTLNTGAGRAFTSADITQFSNFVTIFDQYKFDTIELWIMPNSATVGANEGSGLLVSAVDYDNATGVTPTVLMEHTNAAISLHNCGHYHIFKPHVAVAAYSGAFTSYKNDLADWIDCVSTGVQHFGIVVASAPTPIGIQTIDVLCRINVTFRNVV